jgi:alpha-glucosidase
MHWADLAVDAQQVETDSMLSLYRAALGLRRSEPGLGDGPMTWLPSDDEVLSFRRGDRFLNVTNMSPQGVPLPPGAELLLASTELVDGLLPRDATAWLRTPAASSTAPGGG